MAKTSRHHFTSFLRKISQRIIAETLQQIQIINYFNNSCKSFLLNSESIWQIEATQYEIPSFSRRGSKLSKNIVQTMAASSRNFLWTRFIEVSPIEVLCFLQNIWFCSFLQTYSSSHFLQTLFEIWFSYPSFLTDGIFLHTVFKSKNSPNTINKLSVLYSEKLDTTIQKVEFPK